MEIIDRNYFTGANISVRDPKWALAIEVCLGAQVKGFCVDNHKDERVLEEIFSQVCPHKSQKPLIFTSSFQVRGFIVFIFVV